MMTYDELCSKVIDHMEESGLDPDDIGTLVIELPGGIQHDVGSVVIESNALILKVES